MICFHRSFPLPFKNRILKIQEFFLFITLNSMKRFFPGMGTEGRGKKWKSIIVEPQNIAPAPSNIPAMWRRMALWQKPSSHPQPSTLIQKVKEHKVSRYCKSLLVFYCCSNKLPHTYGLKYKFTILQSWRSEVQNGFHLVSKYQQKRTAFLLEALEKKSNPLPFPPFKGHFIS